MERNLLIIGIGIVGIYMLINLVLILCEESGVIGSLYNGLIKWFKIRLPEADTLVGMIEFVLGGVLLIVLRVIIKIC